jgi:hypothetical protein
VVTVTRIDRLARSTFDLFAIVKLIVDAKAQFRDSNRWSHLTNLRRRRFSEHLGVPRAAQRRKTDPRRTVCARCFSRLASRCGAAATSLC